MEKEQEQAWRRFASEAGGEFLVEDGLSLGRFRLSWSGKVVTKVRQWTIVLDSYGGGGSYAGSPYTTMWAGYVSEDGFRFKIRHRGSFDALAKRFFEMRLMAERFFLSSEMQDIEMQYDIEVGHPDFDRDFIVQGNDESRVRALFANERIRQVLQARAGKDIEFGGGRYGLMLKVPGHIEHVPRLRALHELVVETLDERYRIGAISEEAPDDV